MLIEAAERATRIIRSRIRSGVIQLSRRCGVEPHVDSEERRYWEQRGHRYRAEVASILDPSDPYCRAQAEFVGRLRGLAWTSALEVGCGFGWHLKALGQAFPERRLTGVDFSASQLRNARTFLTNAGTCVCQADARRLPFADSQFDVVYTSGVLMYAHPSEIQGVLRELARVSRRWVVALEPAAEHMDTPGRAALARTAGWHLHRFTEVFPSAGLGVSDACVFEAFRDAGDRAPLGFFCGRKTAEGAALGEPSGPRH